MNRPRTRKALVAMPHPLPDSVVEVIAERFRVLGEPMRIRIIDRLRDGEATIGELADALGTSQQNVSKHVGLLARAGLVAREKDGNSVRCRIADETVLELCEQVCGGLQRQLAELQTLLGAGGGI
jgi:DNA-binding transcriptional ArsR family regulator